jgi:hypothetical protein
MINFLNPFLLIIFFSLIECNFKRKHNLVSKDSRDSIQFEGTLLPYQTDTAIIGNKKFVLSIYSRDSIQCFIVQKEINGDFKTILVDSDYYTNNSNLFFNDQNKDGYPDIVWTKKWQDHSYLFSPKLDNFSEVGEFHDIDTLKENGKPVLYNGKPLLFLYNYEKDLEWMTELHSELFLINDSYQKCSFATIDNFASLDEWNVEKCGSLRTVVVNCYVPPYHGKYGEASIWNSGKSVDSINMKAGRFDTSFISNYWLKNYKKLLPYGQLFQVRRTKPLKYPENYFRY